jgi:hypothetical protein
VDKSGTTVTVGVGTRAILHVQYIQHHADANAKMFLSVQNERFDLSEVLSHC